MKLLDLFCGAGGAAMGYHRAGFDDITGIDHKPQKRYPFKFIQADAMEFLKKIPGPAFNFIHASPPCQGYSSLLNLNMNPDKVYPKLIVPLRKIFNELGIVYCIENVSGAKKDMVEPVMLCGSMFDLKVLRHRLFEIPPGIGILTPQCKHKGTVKNGDYITVAGEGGGQRISSLRKYYRVAACREAMGIDWMTRKELTQAIPPAYTEFLGKQIILQLKG